MNSAQASVFGWHLGSTGKSDLNSEYHMRLPLPFIDDITSDQSGGKLQLNTVQKHQALVWGLSEQQEQRYVLLMRNRSGVYFKNRQLTPVEVLGINARTNEERAQYAAMDAKQEFEKNAKLLGFNAAYDKAAIALKNRLNLPIVRKFDYSKYSPYSYKPMQLKKGDKFMLFVKRNEDVKPIVSYLMTEIERNPSIQLNVYFIGRKLKKNGIVKWAQGQNIPSSMVNDRLITLNFDHGQYAGVKVKPKKTPLLVLVRDGKSRIVDTGRF